jgi:hypothetical protein
MSIIGFPNSGSNLILKPEIGETEFLVYFNRPIGTRKEVLDVFIVKVHVLDKNFLEIWSIEAQTIISF